MNQFHNRLVFFFFITFLSVPFFVSGSGAKREDSIFKSLENTSNIETKVMNCISLAELVKTRSPDSCLLFLDKAQRLFFRINSLPYLGKVYEIKGDIAQLRNDFTGSIRYYRISAFVYNMTGEKTFQMKMLNVIGNMYAVSENVSEAFRYYLNARQIAGEFKDAGMLAKTNNNIGWIFVTSGQFRKGIDYFKKALPLFQASSDSFRTARVLMNLGSAFNQLRKPDSSRLYAGQAMTIFSAIKKRYYLGATYHIYAFSLISEQRYPEALIYLDRALKIAHEPGVAYGLNESILLLSEVLVLTGIAYQHMGD